MNLPLSGKARVLFSVIDLRDCLHNGDILPVDPHAGKRESYEKIRSVQKGLFSPALGPLEGKAAATWPCARTPSSAPAVQVARTTLVTLRQNSGHAFSTLHLMKERSS